MSDEKRSVTDDPDFAVIEEIGRLFEDVTPDEIEREVARAVAEVRAERRRERAARSA